MHIGTKRDREVALLPSIRINNASVSRAAITTSGRQRLPADVSLMIIGSHRAGGTREDAVEAGGEGPACCDQRTAVCGWPKC